MNWPLKHPRCTVCDCRLTTQEADQGTGICEECKLHPDAYKPALPRAFTTADKSLIRQVHSFMPAEQLLGVLNQRLVADLGDKAVPYTIDQLRAELNLQRPAAGGGDWASLRRVLGQARRSGLLDRVTPEVMADFAVVFSLTPAQELRLKDAIAGANS